MRFERLDGIPVWPKPPVIPSWTTETSVHGWQTMGHDKKMARVYLSGQHTMAAIGKHFGVHYATVSRGVKDFEKTEGE